MQSFFKNNFYSMCCMVLFFNRLDAHWTETYHFFPKNFMHKKQSVIVEKKVHEPFNQLLVSWNAALPTRGYLRFFLEVFDEKKHTWSTYKMYEWGAGISRSFLEKDKNSPARYVHVRFEGVPARKYHQFRVKVVALHGASIQVLRSISVCASDLARFKPEALDSYSKNMRPIMIKDVPQISQHIPDYPESSGWCSPASLSQVIEFCRHEPVDLVTLARQVYDSNLNACGSWPLNTAMAGVYLPEYLCYVTRLASLKDLIQLLKQGHPVILSICSALALPGAPKAYDKGHLITVVGIDMRKREIICHDTAEKNVVDTFKRYPLTPFLRTWENRYRLAYVIVPRSA